MRRIKFNVRTKNFSLESDEPNIPEQPDEPTDYLKGIPATVLDLKEPIAKFDEDKDPESISDEYDKLHNKDDFGLQERNKKWLLDFREKEKQNYIEGYKDAVSNFNKESAINRHLNELGSTDYDLSGESFRKFKGILNSPGESCAKAFEAPGWFHALLPEELHIGVGKSGIYNTPDIIAHELGHANDRSNNEFLSLSADTYDTKYDRDDIESRWGAAIADAYETMRPNGISDKAFRHDHTPFEIYADAAALRSGLFKSGLWDGKTPITEDMVGDYLQSESEFNIGTTGSDESYAMGGFSPAKRLDHYFDVSQITDLLNSSRQRHYSELDPDGEELEDDITTVETKDFIGIKEPNRPFHRTSYRFGK